MPVTEEMNVPVEKIGRVNNTGFGALDQTGEIDLPKFDPTPFIGKRIFIESIEEHKGEFGFYILILSYPVDEGNNPIRASKIFGLQEDIEGRIGWPPESKLAAFLKKFNITHYRDLVSNPQTKMLRNKDSGKNYRRILGEKKIEVVIQTRQAKDGNDYLTF